MTDPTPSAAPELEPTTEERYVILLCEVYEMMHAHKRYVEAPSGRTAGEDTFRAKRVCDIINAELQRLNVTTNRATLYVHPDEIPY